WPGSYCDTRRGCCYPLTGKPAPDFSIHGLWPNYKTGKWPQFCDSSAEFEFSQISDLVEELNKHWGSLSCPSSNGHRFWEHEWEKHGTCSLNLNQHDYFEKALSLRRKIDILGALRSAGIRPDGGEYSVSHIKEAIRDETGELPGVDCNVSEEGESQLHEIYVCVDKFDASTIIKCPVYPHSRCPTSVKFPPFGGEDGPVESSHDQISTGLEE
ncbi:hypothetical protein KI387_034526, partial [Taxus chinensis]